MKIDEGSKTSSEQTVKLIEELTIFKQMEFDALLQASLQASEEKLATTIDAERRISAKHLTDTLSIAMETSKLEAAERFNEMISEERMRSDSEK